MSSPPPIPPPSHHHFEFNHSLHTMCSWRHLPGVVVVLLLLWCHGATATFVCLGSSGTYATGSSYGDNLKQLLTAMAAQTPVNHTFNDSRGDPPYEVYGIALCTNNRSSSLCSTCADPVCKSCMESAVADALTDCANRKVAVGVFDNCMMSWNNESYSSLASPPPPPPPPEPRDAPPPPTVQVESPPAPPSTGSASSDTTGVGGGKKSVPAYAVAVPVVVGLGVIVGGLLLWWKRRRTTSSLPVAVGMPVPAWKPPPAAGEAVEFDYRVLKSATNNFAESNLLGRGGFGPVYKGQLQDGQQVAIKMLGTGSTQGIQELNNEVLIVTKLQHKNLVRVLGYCLQKQETMLVYEFMPNTSLDKFLVDPYRCGWLTWGLRFKIINGISRGLMYLHQDSRLMIIHRDMKASNILLDAYMNPKISDFGLAKLFDDNQTYANTSRVAGTLGYIAPEFLGRGTYSTKSDVYSFGIIVLEIVTGRLVNSFQGPGRGLANYVIRYWNEGSALQALDPRLGGVCIPDEVMTSLYVGLLCCQADANRRPEIATAIAILSGSPPSSQISRATFS